MNTEIEKAKKEVFHWMLEYILDDNTPPYTKKDVDEFDSIVTKFINEVSVSNERTSIIWITDKIKQLTINLNDFNEKHDHSIIETDQREGICELIDQILISCGHEIEEDITEEWREW